MDSTAGPMPDDDAGGEGPLRDIAQGHRPRTFGDYELLGEVGSGGMGAIWKARQVSLNRVVALKMMLAANFARPDFVQRFRREAQAAARLQHPNIVAIHEVGEHDGMPFYSMDYVQGKNLAQLIQGAPLPSTRAARYVHILAKATQHAHEHGILHRDLKPSNVIMDELDQPRIADFGLARSLDDQLDLTLGGQVVGTPSFSSPEQLEGGHGHPGPAVDVYGLGAILYFLLTARPPFAGASIESTLALVLHEEPVPPRLFNPSVPRDLETICLKCLEKDPARRFPSAQALADELGRFLRNEPILARPVSSPERAWRWCRRQPGRAGLLAALLVVFIAGFAGVSWQWLRAERKTREEARQRLRFQQSEYAADMMLAQQAILDNDLSLATSLLDKHRPASLPGPATPPGGQPGPESPTDLRHWEWRHLWQQCQGDELLTLHRYPNTAFSLAVSANGERLAVRTARIVALWDLARRRPLIELSNASGNHLAVSGNLLAFGMRQAGGAHSVELWNMDNQRLVRSFPHQSAVNAIALSRDGSFLATFEENGTIRITDATSQRLLRQLTAPTPRRGEAGALVFLPDDTRLAIGEDFGKLHILNWHTGADLPIPTHTTDGVTALAFSPTTGLLAAGFAYSSGFIGLWDARSGEPRGSLTNHVGWIRDLAFTADGRRLASASVDRTIRIWDVPSRTEIRLLLGHQKDVMSLAFLPDEKTLISGAHDGSVRFWDVGNNHRTAHHATVQISHGTTPMHVPITSASQGVPDPKTVNRLGLAFTPDSRSVLTTDRDGVPGLHDAVSLQRVKQLPELGTQIWNLALSPDGRWLAVTDTAGSVRLWDWPARREVARDSVPFEWSGHLRFSPSGRFLLATLFTNVRRPLFRVWQVDPWKEVPLPENQVTGLWCLGLSPDDSLLALGYADGTLKLRNFPDNHGESTLAKRKGPITSVVFSPDGQTLASTGIDGLIGLWDTRSRRESAVLRGHWTSVWSAAFSPDGRRLATGAVGRRDAIKLWDLATGRVLLTMPGEDQFYMTLTFSPDGAALAATTLYGQAHLWRAPSWADIGLAEKALLKP